MNCRKARVPLQTALQDLYLENKTLASGTHTLYFFPPQSVIQCFYFTDFPCFIPSQSYGYRLQYQHALPPKRHPQNPKQTKMKATVLKWQAYETTISSLLLSSAVDSRKRDKSVCRTGYLQPWKHSLQKQNTTRDLLVSTFMLTGVLRYI